MICTIFVFQTDIEENLGEVLPKNATYRAKTIKQYLVQLVDKDDCAVKKVTDIKKYAVFDPTLTRPIFEKVVEYLEWHRMLDDLTKSAYKDEKSIVYCSSAFTARRIMAYIRANPIMTSKKEKDPIAVPRMALVTGEVETMRLVCLKLFAS